jgi:molybdopterin molybdotransferase
MPTTMRPFASTLPFNEALARLEAAVYPIDRTELVALADAAGRVLAEPVAAGLDVPPFDRAVMDGYAVAAEDTAGASAESPRVLRHVGVTHAGQVATRRLGPRECLEIATGAPLPPGADAVVMVERTTRRADEVSVQAPVSAWQNVGRRGSDMSAGDALLGRGAQLTPARLGALAAQGLTRVPVLARPRVLVASTGSELVAPGAALLPGRIYDVNAVTLAPVIETHGGVAIRGGILPDDLDTITILLREARADLVVVSGGSSVGTRDLLIDALTRLEAAIVFHGIGVKPGKPTLLARVGERLVLGMPGNPTSCLSNAYILLVPLLRRMARLPEWRPERRRLRLSAAVRSTPERHQFYPVAVDGESAVPVFKGSGDISAADGYMEIPVGIAHLDAGAEVVVTLF